jgi:hypothetical protein
MHPCNYICVSYDHHRFPLRTKKAAAESEISNASYTEQDIRELLYTGFKETAYRFLLFLRNVERIEVYEMDSNDKEPRYATDVNGTKGFAATTVRAVQLLLSKLLLIVRCYCR